MKIGILSQWFDPEPGPAAIPGVLARELVLAGHEVSVLTGYPNYPEGRIYPGFENRRTTVSHDLGYSVTRVPLFPSHDRSARGRLRNYLSFALSASFRGRGALRGVDAIWVYNSPITVGLPLMLHSRWGRTPIFLQVQDLWPDTLIDSGMFPSGAIGRAAKTIISAVVRFLEKRSAVVGVSSEGAREIILRRNPRLRPDVITSSPNPTDESLFQPSSGAAALAMVEASSPEKFTVMYVGAVGDVQGLDAVVDAANALRENDGVRFAIVGDGIAKERLANRARQLGLHNIEFVGRVDKALVPAYIATASVQLVSLAKKPFLEYTTPSKIASLLASGVPIIGQIEGDSARLIAASGSGVLAEPGNAESLVLAIRQLMSMDAMELRAMGDRGFRYYTENLSAEVFAANVVRSLSQVVGRRA